MDRTQIIVLTLPGFPDSSLAIAGCRAGGRGVLDLEYIFSAKTALQLIDGLVRLTDKPFGLRVEVKRAAFVNELLSSSPPRLEFVVLASQDNLDIQPVVDCCKLRGINVLLECTGLRDAEAGRTAGVDGIIVKGNEAGGRVGRES
ncbi:MAG: beta-ketoacyl synthase, partial [uncultured bacterium]